MLTAEQFKSITENLRSDGPKRGSIDKRSGPRVGMRARLVVFPNGQEEMAMPVWLRDLSRTGIGLVHSQAMAQGDTFMVRFPMGRDILLLVFYTVIHCKALGRNLYSVGARLERSMLV